MTDKFKKIINISDLNKLIINNNYVINCKSNKNKDSSSISSLIKKKLSQSECIKFGIAIEKIFLDIVLNYTNLKNIKVKNKIGIKETDHLFSDDNKKIIYYAEFKSNINLDTEKSKSTYTKCLIIKEELKNKYPDYKINWCIVACRYTNKNKIPNNLINKYIIVKNNMYGINDYLKLLNINIYFTFRNYCVFLNTLSDNMFNDNIKENNL